MGSHGVSLVKVPASSRSPWPGLTIIFLLLSLQSRNEDGLLPKISWLPFRLLRSFVTVRCPIIALVFRRTIVLMKR